MTMTMEQFRDAQGEAVYSSEGEKIGQVEEIFLDIDTQKPEWIGIGTGFLRMKRVLVPVEGATQRENGFSIPYTKDQVQGSPDIDDDEISQETEQELYSYYGLPSSESRSDTGLPAGGPSAEAGTNLDAGDRGPNGDVDDEGSLIRSEEELRVGVRQTQAGGMRLRKWVETEPVQEDVELRQERAYVEREPINQQVSDAEIGELEIEVPLVHEEAVVEKQTVAKERVRVEKEVDTRTESVGEELRKERIDIDGDGAEERTEDRT